MTIDLYTCNADPRQRDKTGALSQISSSVTISPTSSLDSMNPTIIIEYNESWIPANYAYISLFGAYYFLEKPKVIPGKRISFQGKIDVLMTYSSYLESVPATVIRSESIGKPTPVPDNQLPINPQRYELKSILFNKSFPQDANKPSYILIT